MIQRAFSTGLQAKAVWVAMTALTVIPLQLTAESLDSVTVTIYRPQGTLRGNTLLSCDHNNYRIVVYSDGKKILRIHKGHFVTLRLPVGHHNFKSTRSKTLEIDLKSAGQYFIRPRQTCGGSFLAQEAVELVACEEALTETHKLEPLAADDIYIENSMVDSFHESPGACKARPIF